MFFDRLNTLIKRRVAAANLMIKFERCATFNLPNSLHLNGQIQQLSLPNENGVKVAFIELLLDDCYRCKELKNRGKPIKTILDIGGNVGLFGLAARSSFPNAKIHSYEPNRNLEKYLSNQSKFVCFDYFIEAVGLENGMVTLDFDNDSVQTRSILDGDGNVPQVAFSQAIERMGGSVDLLKMDCEGAEWEIFKDKESWGKVKNLSMEYHLFEPGHTKQTVKDTVTNLGFRITSFIPSKNFGLLFATRN